MKAIQKGKEPNSLTEHRSSASASFDNLSQAAKQELREALAAEQGHLCCYCMSRIDPGKDGRDFTMKVEHWASQDEHPQLQLAYSNLLGACTGGEGSPRQQQHCDTHKGNSVLTLDPRHPSSHPETLRYLHDGTIQATDAELDRQVNEVLNLNVSTLKQNRKVALEEYIKRLSATRSAGAWPAGSLERERLRCSTPGKGGKLSPYAGMLLWWLGRQIKSR